MSTRFRIRLPRDIHDALIAQAKAELPNECCGLLAGRFAEEQGERVARIEVHHPLINELASRVEYLSEPRSMFDAIRAIDRGGREIVAVYHSHPTSEPVPSKKDRERNYSPTVPNFIISLMDGKPLLRAWWLEADQQTEADWLLID